MAFVLIVFIVVVGIAAAGYVIAQYNSLVSLKNNIGKAWSNIDVLLKQRHDELTKLLEAVKGYMEFEKDVMVQVTQARSMYAQSRTINEKAKADDMMTSTLKSLFAVSENYPELKADQMFIQFQNRITDIESQIADRREFYNDSVNLFNTRIEQFPDAIIARNLGYTPKPYFKATENDKKDVVINFR